MAIPTDGPALEAKPEPLASSAGRAAVGVAEAPPATEAPPAAGAASVADDLPDDADAPPEDVEPPFDPGLAPEIVVDASPPAGAAISPVDGGVQRYGESVVREVLGATFLEEVEAPGRPGFGERG